MCLIAYDLFLIIFLSSKNCNFLNKWDTTEVVCFRNISRIIIAIVSIENLTVTIAQILFKDII